MTRGFTSRSPRDSANPSVSVGGDINYPPHSPDHPAPDYATMRPYNKASRPRLPSETGGVAVPVPDRRVTEMLSCSGYVDAAWELYERTGDEDLLRRTGTDDRIDQLWVSAPLRDTLTSYRLLDQPAGASDHHGLLVQLNLGQAQTDNVWEYQ